MKNQQSIDKIREQEITNDLMSEAKAKEAKEYKKHTKKRSNQK